MYPVSQEFQEKIVDQFNRRVYGKVQIDYTDPFLDQSIDTEANGNANVSFPQQIADGVRKPSGKIASLDGSWKLDGTYKLFGEGDQIGWWGSQLSDSNGVFAAPYPTVTSTFFSRSIHSLRVVGDSLREEYPVNFIIRLYNNEEVLYLENVENNNQVVWEKTIPAVTQVTKMELEVQSWSHQNRQTKILELFTSVQEVYEGKDIISVNLIEERGTSIGGLPVGSITSNEITVVLSNKDRKFDAGNTQSPLYEMLKPNRRIKAWLGVERDNGEKEFVPLGIFWSGDWEVTEEGISAKVSGRDRLELLSKLTYEYTGKSEDNLYNLALDVLTDAELNSDEYWIDSELENYIIPNIDLSPQSHREVLSKIAGASLGQVYCDRKGIIRIEGSTQVSKKNIVSVSENANVSYPNQLADGVDFPDGLFASLDGTWSLEEDYMLAPETESLQMGWWGSQLSDGLGYFSAPYPTITLEFETDRAINAIKVVGDSLREEYPVDYTIKVYDINGSVLVQNEVIGNTEINNITNFTENPTNSRKVEIIITKWSHPNRQVKILECLDVEFKLNIGPALYFKKNNPAKYLEVANYIEVPYGEEKVILRDEDSIIKNGLLKYSLQSNPLIQTEERALDIANRLLEGYSNPQRDLDLEWRGNPALALGDMVSVIDHRETNDYKVVKQELEYAGYLRARLSGRRV